MQSPSFSIITVCLNAAKSVERTIKSVVGQSYRPLEYIIVDGQSTDRTLDIIKSYKNQIKKFICEKDQGLYDAMNKGIKLADGDYILFLNADDYFFDEKSIERIAHKIIESDKDKDIYYGNVLVFDPSSGKANLWQPGNISRYSLFRGPIPHPATIYSHNAFIKNGYFDITYSIAADYDWIVRAFVVNELDFRYLNTLVAVFSKGGPSTNSNFQQHILAEKKRIRKTHYPFYEGMYLQCCWRLKKIFGIF